MADETQATTATPQKKPRINVQFSNSAKVSAAVVAGAITNLLIFFMSPWATKNGLDIASQQGNITVVVTAVVGYIVREDA